MIYIHLFVSFLKIGAFSFGGGYAALPLIQSEVVSLHHWMSMNEFTDLITISQMTPGPIAINSATFVGIKTAGLLGAICATLGCILPSCIIVTLIAWLYLKFRKLDTLQNILELLRPAVVAMIATAGVAIIISSFWGGQAITMSTLQMNAVVIFCISMFLLLKCRSNPIRVMLLAGVLNILYALLTGTV